MHNLERAASWTEGAGQVHNEGKNGAADARGALWYERSNASEKLRV